MNEDVFATIARKQREIEERQKDISELEELLRLADKHRLEVSSPNIGAGLDQLRNRLEVTRTVPQTLRERIIAAAETVLSDGQRRFARELLPELLKYGVRLEGKNPAGNLASYLSREKDRFISDAKMGGWTLRVLAQKGRAPDVGASRALFSN
jgi:hypothetical protein